MPFTDQHRPYTVRHQALTLCVCLTFFMLPVATAPLTVGSLLALAVWLLSGTAYRDRGDWLGQEWLLPLAALVVLPWIGILWSAAPLNESLKLAERSHYWLFALVSATAMKSEGALRKVMACFVTGTTLIAVFVALYLCGAVPETAYLHNFLFRSYITFSLLLVISILLLAFYCRSVPRPRMWLMMLLMLFLAMMVTQLKGRSAYLALALLSPWIVVIMCGRPRLVPLLGSLLLAALLLLSSGTVRERLALISKEITMYQSGASSSYLLPDGSSTLSSIGQRLEMWKDALEIFRRHPLIGAGTAGYQPEVRRIDPGRNFAHPHNSYLYIAANYGLLGIALHGWLLAVILKRAWRGREQLAGHAVLAFLAVILIGSLTETQILSTATGIALGFVAGIPVPGREPCAS